MEDEKKDGNVKLTADQRKEISEKFQFTWSEHIKFMNGGLIVLVIGSILFLINTVLSKDSVLEFAKTNYQILFYVGLSCLTVSLIAGVVWRWLFHLLMDREVIGFDDAVRIYLAEVGTGEIPYRFKESINTNLYLKGHRFLPWFFFLLLADGWACIISFIGNNL